MGEHSDDPAVERALHFIYENVNQFYNFKGLHEFKGKFAPEWSPRYLIYPRPASLMTIAPALTRASAGDALLRDYSRDLVQSVPHLWRRWRQQGKQEA